MRGYLKGNCGLTCLAWAAMVAPLFIPQTAAAQATSESDAGTQDTPQEDPVGADRSDPQDKSDIIVQGFRKASADAIEAKRREIEITDGISADDMGRIPDLNLGEALQRVPGIQLNREAEGREATVNLRGLPGEYARTTLNGVAFAEPILLGSTPLGAFATDIFSGVRVEKSPMAHAQTGGLSGNIDLQIAPALSRKDGFRLKAAYDYNELGARTEPNFTAGFNKHITDRFAIFGVAAYKREDFRRDSIIFNSYGVLSTSTTPDLVARYADYYAPAGTCSTTYKDVVGCVAVAGGTGAKGQKGIQYVNSNRQYTRINKGKQISFSTGAEWQATDRLKLGVIGLYTNRDQDGTYQNLQIMGFTGTGTRITPTGPVISGANGSNFIEDFDFANTQAISDSRAFPQKQSAWGINGTIDYKTDHWHLTTVITDSKAENWSQENFAWFVKGAGAGNGISGSYSTGGGDFSQYSLVVNPVPLSSGTPRNSWTWAGSTDPQSWYDSPAGTVGRNRFNFGGTQGYATSKVKAIQQDIERKFDAGFLTSVQVGFRAERNQFNSVGSRTNAAGIQGQNISNDFLMTNPDVDDFFGGQGGNYSTNWLVLNLPYVFDQLRPVTPYNGNALARTGWNITFSDNNYALYNFTSQTDLLEGYGEARFKLSLFSIPLRGIAGLRYESANVDVDALNRIKQSPGLGSPSDYAEQSFHNSYDHLLPSAIIVADITDKFLMRFTGYKTYVRPHPRQFTPITLVGAPTLSGSDTVVSVQLGNPDLQPYSGTSFDVSLEWYNRKNGLISLAAFTKRFTGVIQQVKGAAALCPADATLYGLGHLSVQGDQCVSDVQSPLVPGTPLVVNFNGYVNSPTPYRVTGVEFNIQQNLDFLPGVLRFLGGGFNYAYTTISGTNPDGSPAKLPGISKHNINAIGYFETKKYALRLAYNWRSNYDLAMTSTFSGDARQVAPRGQLDLAASLKMIKGVSLNFNAFNLTNSIRKEYQGTEEMARRADYDGRTYRFSINAVF